MPVFFGAGAVFPFSGFCQLSGTKVVPVLRLGAAAVLSGTGGTTVKPPHMGHGISHTEYCSSYSRACLQCEHSNLIWLIKLPFLMRCIIIETAESSSFFSMA